jgi:hypothetical protein
MLTLRERQERAARRAARIAAMHQAIRQAACMNHEGSEVMKKNEVKVGGTFLAKVSDKVVPVRITGESRYGGWDAVNTKTGKAVRIKSAQRLRGPAGLTKAEVQAAKTAVAAHVGAGAKPAAESAKDTKAAPVAAVGQPAATETKAAKLAAWRKEVAEKAGKPDPALDAAVKAAEEGRKAKKAKAAKPKGERKPGILTLAADVLKDAKAPMDCRTIVEKVLAKGLWHTKGKTPAATLYAAIIREMAAKGKDARFRKTGRGQFELSAAARQ